jgi:UDP-N-acetylglucosamine--N-acetylmuramyl-(pentapeptide) pyrophosphoryl-undecaprenol N-acetylglucosamine transferase
MKLLVTGGHLTPALALLEYIQTKNPEWKIVFVGRKNAIVGDSTISEEYRILLEKKVRFIGLSAGRVRRFFSIGTIISLLMIPVGFIQSFLIVLKEKPTCIVSFGGYIGLPIVVAGWFLRIPSVIHEQAAVPGLSNTISSVFARRICVSNDAGVAHFPKKKTVITGLPLRKTIFNPPNTVSFRIPSGRKILYITGGATGSQSINGLVYPIIGRLLGKYTVIHQVGRAWVSEARKIRIGIRGDKRKYYFVQAYFDENDHAWLMHHASLLVGRAGANTVAEIDAVGVPALLIPLPWSAAHEQYENAKVLVRKHKAVSLNQLKLDSDSLLRNIIEMLDSTTKHAEGDSAKRYIDAPEMMVSVIAGSQS